MKLFGSPEIISCIALNLNSQGSCSETTRGISSIIDPVLGRSRSLVVLKSLIACKSTDSAHPQVPMSSPSTEPTDGGVTVTVTESKIDNWL